MQEVALCGMVDVVAAGGAVEAEVLDALLCALDGDDVQLRRLAAEVPITLSPPLSPFSSSYAYVRVSRSCCFCVACMIGVC